MRLGMSLIVRDEADIIAENIKFHAQNGVDAFVVVDNGSKDGTRDILADLCTSYDMDVIDYPGLFIQEKIATGLAEHLRVCKHVDWLISNDADEFWVPRTGDLKSCISMSIPVARAPRYNLLPTKKDIADRQYRFFHNVMLVENPLGPQPPTTDPDIPLKHPMMLRTFPPKVMCRMAGLKAIHQGNHDVEHIGKPANDIDEITVFHFPLRQYDAFETKIRNHSESFKDRPPEASWHLRRWFACYQRGTLKNEYDSMLLTDEKVENLLSTGVIREERRIADFFMRANSASSFYDSITDQGLIK